MGVAEIIQEALEGTDEEGNHGHDDVQKHNQAFNAVFNLPSSPLAYTFLLLTTGLSQLELGWLGIDDISPGLPGEGGH
jgi:hypothetical protein